MELEYSNQVTGSDFRTASQNFTIEGSFRKDASGNITELVAHVKSKKEPYGVVDEVSFKEEPRFNLYGKTGDECAEIVGAIDSIVQTITAAEEAE